MFLRITMGEEKLPQKCHYDKIVIQNLLQKTYDYVVSFHTLSSRNIPNRGNNWTTPLVAKLRDHITNYIKNCPLCGHGSVTRNRQKTTG